MATIIAPAEAGSRGLRAALAGIVRRLWNCLDCGRHSRWHRDVLPITVCIAAFCWQAADLPAQAPKPTEYQVKAAYLLNFGRFIEWPAKTGATPEEPFQVCVLGQDPFGPILDAALAGETINHAPLAAKRIAKPQDASVCRILFISASEEHSLKSILPALDKTAVLTVSDIAQFTRQGGMIQFVLSGNRVRFDVNLVAVRAAGLNLSSELLKLALSVKRTP